MKLFFWEGAKVVIGDLDTYLENAINFFLVNMYVGKCQPKTRKCLEFRILKKNGVI
jgi:hypothetical protein